MKTLPRAYRPQLQRPANWLTIISQMASTTEARSRKATRSTRIAARSSALELGWKRLVHFLETGSRGANSYVVLLGLRAFDSVGLRQAVDDGFPYWAFEQLVANTSLTPDETQALIGVPTRTLTRRKAEGRFHSGESDKLLRASRVFAHAVRLFEGDREAAKEWLSLPQRALANQVPLHVARTEVGALEVERLMGRLEHGVFT